MVSSYQTIIFALCALGYEDQVNTLGALIGRTGVVPAFGGECGIKLGLLGPERQTHWATFHLARGVGAQAVEEYNGSAPYQTLNSLGVSDAQVDALKAVLIADALPRATHERAFTQWIADKGYEVMP